jgi:hypothetical protein
MAEQAVSMAYLQQALLPHVAAAELSLGQHVTGKYVAVGHDVEEPANTTVDTSIWIEAFGRLGLIGKASLPHPADSCPYLLRPHRPLRVSLAPPNRAKAVQINARNLLLHQETEQLLQIWQTI